MNLLSEDGNSPEHDTARLLVMQCQEVASHPTFRPYYSDVSPTFICLDKRETKPPSFYNPCESKPAKKCKPAVPKKEKNSKLKPNNLEKLESEQKMVIAKCCIYFNIDILYEIKLTNIHLFIIT